MADYKEVRKIHCPSCGVSVNDGPENAKRVELLCNFCYEKKERENNYLSHSGFLCLFCYSNNLQSESHTTEGEFIYQKIVCHACKRTWKDVYHLTGVIEN